MTTAPAADALVPFGVSRDLASRRVLPARYGLAARGLLNLPVIGVVAGGWDGRALAGHTGAAILAARRDADRTVLSQLRGRIHMITGDAFRFARNDSVKEAWRIVQPLLDHPPPVIATLPAPGGRRTPAGLTPFGWHPVQLNHQHAGQARGPLPPGRARKSAAPATATPFQRATQRRAAGP